MTFDPPVAIASLSGESDAVWAKRVADLVGAAFLGGIAIDDASRAAARRLVADRDRTEFLPDDPIAFIDRELAALADVPMRTAFNVRSSTRAPVRAAAAVCLDHDAILEINAHCRQPELCTVGCGESLLGDPNRLDSFVRTAAEAGPSVSVKMRAEVPGVDLPATARRAAAAGADYIHVDAMDTERIIAEVVATVDERVTVIANNGVRDRATAVEYLESGADAVSVGRPSDRPEVLARVRTAVDEWVREREVPG